MPRPPQRPHRTERRLLGTARNGYTSLPPPAHFINPVLTPTAADGKNTAYFRGRKLHGQAVKLPAAYRGVVGVRRDSPREQARSSGSGAPPAEAIVDVDATAAEQEAQRQRLDTGRLAVLAEFDEVVVWGHQSTADAATDPYVRGLDEWLALSEEVLFVLFAPSRCLWLLTLQVPY